jgi:putative polyhydroxyalkanoate system protein
MPNLTVSIPHQLPREEAKRRVEELVANLQRQYGGMASRVQQNWTGDTLNFAVSAMGVSVTGEVRVTDEAVHLEVVLPFALAMLAGGVKQQIEDEGRKLLSVRPPSP